MTLTDLLAAHRAKAEAASIPNGCRKPRSTWRILYGSVVSGRGGSDYFTVCREDSFSAFGGRTLTHIAANDPATVLALIAVAEAAIPLNQANIHGYNYDTERLNSALDNLTRVLGGEE